MQVLLLGRYTDERIQHFRCSTNLGIDRSPHTEKILTVLRLKGKHFILVKPRARLDATPVWEGELHIIHAIASNPRPVLNCLTRATLIRISYHDDPNPKQTKVLSGQNDTLVVPCVVLCHVYGLSESYRTFKLLTYLLI